MRPKFGLGGFSEALAKEVAPLGIKVTCIEPGGFRTDWGGASMSFAPEVEGYETTVGWMAGFFKSGNYVPVGDPDKAAKVMIDLVGHPDGKKIRATFFKVALMRWDLTPYYFIYIPLSRLVSYCFNVRNKSK